jgi:isopenicillin N synthase-like dioxygenase
MDNNSRSCKSKTDKFLGFFYIINFGLSQEQVDRQFSLCKQVFDLSTDEKMKYRADLENGGYNGYKPFGIRDVKPGIKDNTEIYNIPKFIPEYDREHPQLVRDHWDEIEHFARHIHSQIVGKLLVLFAIVLELPDDYFLNNHQYEAKSDDHLRWMKYHKRTPEQNDALDNIWVKGHTDFGSLTLLFRQAFLS